MDYRKFGDCYYIRMDRDDEIITTILDVCKREEVKSATFSGIGGCSSAEIQVFNPDKGTFETEAVKGMLELVGIMGNVISDEDDNVSYHAHALFAYRDGDGIQQIAAGHLKSTTVLYTAEIELRPVIGGVIGYAHDPVTNTGFWKLS